MFDTIVWATDGSAHADRVVPYVQELAAKHGSRIVVMHVLETYPAHIAANLPLRADEDDLKAKVDRQAQYLAAAGLRAELMLIPDRAPHAAHAIAEKAAEIGADLIVAGARGHTRLPGLVLGSVTHRLLQIAPCPVLTVPAVAAERDTEGAEAAAATA